MPKKGPDTDVDTDKPVEGGDAPIGTVTEDFGSEDTNDADEDDDEDD